MVYYILITFPITIMVFGGMFFLGRFLALKSESFQSIIYNTWALGFVVYFALTFIVFLPFIIIGISLPYYIAIFFIKEFFIYTFLVANSREIFKGIDWKRTLWIVIASLLITMTYKFGISKFFVPESIIYESKFQTFTIFSTTISSFSHVNQTIINDGVVSIIVSSFALTTINSFISEFSTHWDWKNDVLGLILTILFISLFNFSLPLHLLAGVFMSLFVFLVCIRLISYSRRRYGMIFAISVIATYSINNRFILTLAILALVVMITYTFLIKPRIALFWVQLGAPLIIVECIDLYTYSAPLSIFLVIISASVYLFIFSKIGNRFLEFANTIIIKLRIIIPIVISLLMITLVIIFQFKNKIDWNDLYILNNPITNHWVNTYSRIVQIVIFFSISLCLLIIVIIRFTKEKKLSKKVNFALLILLLLFIFGLNPIANAIACSISLKEEYQYLNSIFIIPCLLLGMNVSREAIKKRAIFLRR